MTNYLTFWNIVLLRYFDGDLQFFSFFKSIELKHAKFHPIPLLLGSFPIAVQNMIPVCNLSPLRHA